jgi:hypothetical protein
MNIKNKMFNKIAIEYNQWLNTNTCIWKKEFCCGKRSENQVYYLSDGYFLYGIRSANT